jgi:hypothetical protein
LIQNKYPLGCQQHLPLTHRVPLQSCLSRQAGPIRR